MVFHQFDTEGNVEVLVAGVRERRKSESMDLWVEVNLPYQRMEIGMSPSSKAPLWYVRRFEGF